MVHPGFSLHPWPPSGMGWVALEVYFSSLWGQEQVWGGTSAHPRLAKFTHMWELERRATSSISGKEDKHWASLRDWPGWAVLPKWQRKKATAADRQVLWWEKDTPLADPVVCGLPVDGQLGRWSGYVDSLLSLLPDFSSLHHPYDSQLHSDLAFLSTSHSTHIYTPTPHLLASHLIHQLNTL